MKKHIRHLLSICLLLLSFSSCNTSESYVVTYQAKLRIIEREDHQKCVSQGLDYGDWDEITTELYWRCRYNLVINRRINLAITPESIRNNKIVDIISEEMLKNLNRAKYSALAKMEDDIDLSDHKKCVDMGYDLLIGYMNDGYYKCRQNLVIARIPPAPKITNSFESAILPKDQGVNLKIATESRESNKEAIRVAVLLQKYPNCMGLNVDSADFKKCSEAEDRSKLCVMTINSKQIKKELDDKIYCQQQAFIQFPDNYALAKDKSSNELEKIKLQSKKKNDEDVQKEINTTLLYLEGSRNIDNNIGKESLNSGDSEKQSKEKLYSRVELLKLREQFIYQCDKKMEDKLPDYTKQLTDECLDIARNWDKEDKK